MASPKRRHWQYLMRPGRFLVGRPRLVRRWKAQKLASRKIRTQTDSDWAGCPATRRSTSCAVLRVGRHTIGLSSTTQVPIALSSGEAEFYALAKGASRLRRFSILKIDGRTNPSDLGTKIRCEATSGRHTEALSLPYQAGRSSPTPAFR